MIGKFFVSAKTYVMKIGVFQSNIWLLNLNGVYMK